MKRNIWRKSVWTAVVAAALLGVAACLPVPLGDAEKAKSDPKFIGAWEWKEDGVNKLAIIRNWDDRTYVVDIMSYTGTAEAPKPTDRSVYKGWLAEVKGTTFLNLQPIESLSVLPGQKREVFYLVLKVVLAGDRLVATNLDGEYAKFKDVGTSSALEKIVAENMDDVKMWGKPVETTRMGAGRVEELDRIIKAFSSSGE